MPRPLAFSRTLLWTGIVYAVFGVWLPWRLGVAFLDNVVLGAYASLGVIFAAPWVAASGKMIRPVLTGIGISWAMLVTGVVLVYSTHNVMLGPDILAVAECGLFGATLSMTVASIVIYVRAVRSEPAARMAARLLLLALLALFYFKSRWLPHVALTGAVGLSGICLIFTRLLRRRRDA